MFKSRLGLRLSVILGAVLALLLAGGLTWLDHNERQSMAEQAEQSTEQTALALEASLKSIMLAGEGPIAHDWLKRVRQTTDFDDVRIYRRDGTEAFVDNATIDRVNVWLGTKHFAHHDREVKPETLPPSLGKSFTAAAAGTETRVIENGRLTLLLPIRIENACLQCHGYDGAPANPVRGVLKLSVPTSALTKAMAGQRNKILWSVAAVILLTGGLLMWLLNREVIRPIGLLQAGAKKIETGGDHSYRVTLDRTDELGSLANMFNELVSHLQQQTIKQATMYEAVIGLSRELVDEVLLRKIGELAMQLTDARYAMLSYLKDGEKQFIPLGMDDAQLEKLKGHAPQGLGLLGLLWNDCQVVRAENITNHSKSIGFPEGHPQMTSFLGVPIEFAGKMIGALYLTDKQGGQPFSKDDESAVRMLASSCAVALSNAQQFEHLQEANAELENRVAARTSELNNANRLLRSHEIELELMNDELRHASEAKNQFLANTSHELRTPLNAIIGFSDLLLVKSKELSTKHKEYVEYINISGRRLLELINSLLDLSKIEAGMLEIHQEPTIPSTVLKFMVNHLRPLLDKKGLEVSFILPEEDRTAYLDAGKLQQVWVNLIGNAIKFTPDGGHIEVGFTLKGDDAHAVLEGWVRDSGIGIEPADIERIFQPFVQGEGGLTREFGGTGLGLTLVRRLLEIQGGSIRVESKPGTGSLFAFTLPVQMVAAEGEVGIPLLEGQGEKVESQLLMEVVDEDLPELVELPVILIVDDDKARAAAVSSLLREEGYLGEMTDLGHVELLAEEKCPFLIIVGIPDDPVDIYRQLHLLRSRKATRHIPLVLLGGNAESPSFSLGTVDTMDKQVTRNDLVNLISRHGRQIQHAPSMTVLVIDDEPSVREYIRECLRGQGYRLLLAANGRDGIQAAIEHDPDLIILDLMMPGISGFEVVEELKRHPTACDIPVVIFSAKDLTREEVMRLGQEVEKVLTKGATSRSDLLRELRSMELLYPVQARLMDSVLRCYNLRYRQLRLAQECNRAERYGQTFSLVGWQMDYYDAYVKKYGQHWGVAALKEIVELVNSVTREGDVLVRSGEASFMLILTGTAQSVAERVAEKLRLRIRIHKFPLAGGKTGNFTASFGCVQFGIGAFSPEDLLRQLNALMAFAMKSGGDRCICSEVGES
ncbi:ATP-binding protein [Ferrovum myxofaciens]|uniref:ATP-binding protein n=1 Tax=Ferrovum myxofaciens TaxID=416213 RepID=UPI0004E19A68|nr:ATP-binding protein [Ferrovum myxofaciens]